MAHPPGVGNGRRGADRQPERVLYVARRTNDGGDGHVQILNGIADLEAAAGSHLGHSEWHTVTQEQVDQFAQATGDHQWIHVDVERAQAGPFGGTIAHGFLTLSLVPSLVAEVYTVEGVRMAVNYGADKLRFPAPVPVPSQLRAGVELLRVTPTSLGHQVATRVTVELADADKPACVVDMLAVVVS